MNKVQIRKSCLAVVGALAFSFASNAMADSTEDIVNALINKGVLTEEEGSLLLKSRKGEKEASEKKARSNPTMEVGKKGLVIKTPDNDFSIKIGGRLHADYSQNNNDDNLAGGVHGIDGTKIRRARIALSGTFYKDFDYMIEPDFASDSIAVKDLFLLYHGFKAPLELTVGHQKHGMSMEIQESSNDIMFTERSLVSALTLPYFDRAIGINMKGYGDNWHVEGGFYGESMKNGKANTTEGEGFGIRGTVTPILEKDRLIHFGANYGYRKLGKFSASGYDVHSSGSAPSFGFSTTNNSQLSLVKVTVNNLKSVQTGILEFSAMYGPLSFQSEFAKTSAERDGASNLDFNAYYMQIGYTLTGESRTYKGSDGEFKRLKPNNNFSLEKGGWGAWELAGRYDKLDVEDKNVAGGAVAKRGTLALNWYLNEDVRLMAEYSKTFDLSGGGLKKTNGSFADDIDVFTLRTQWAF